MGNFAVKNEKVFEFFGDLPDVNRMMIIDEMQPDDRCRFTRCSKLSQKEAESSKNYINALEFSAVGKNWVKITISYDKFHEIDKDHKGFSWQFGVENGKKYRRYTCRRGNTIGVEIWKEDIDNSTNIARYSAKLFKNLLKKYQNTIKGLSLMGFGFSKRLKNYDFAIRSLNKLESLLIDDDMDILYYLSKLQRPLKHLNLRARHGASYLADREELYQITDSVSMASTKITYEQMCRLSATTVSMPFGDITEMEICDFIRSWQNGTLEKEVKKCLWNNSADKTFDIPELLRLLDEAGVFAPPPESNGDERSDVPLLGYWWFVINHNQNAEMKGLLWCNNSFTQLMFTVR